VRRRPEAERRIIGSIGPQEVLITLIMAAVLFAIIFCAVRLALSASRRGR
jgi:hypothetical protein